MKDKLLQYYEHGGNSMMQLFKVSDNVGLQLIVHSDGTSTMETISLNGTENENVVKIQKEHCERTRKLKEVLKRNWDIEIELEEKASADHVAFEFETIRQKVDKTNSYMEVRRKKQSKNDERMLRRKRKEYSIALLVYMKYKQICPDCNEEFILESKYDIKKDVPIVRVLQFGVGS